MGELAERFDTEKEALLTAVAFSCNKEVVEKVEGVLQERGKLCFYFHENFLLFPLSSQVTEEEVKRAKTCFPFLRRYLEMPNIQFIPDWKALQKLIANGGISFGNLMKNVPFRPKDIKALKELYAEGFLKKVDLTDPGTFGKGLFSAWQDMAQGKDDSYIKQKYREWGDLVLWREKGTVGFSGKYSTDYIRGEYFTEKLARCTNLLPVLMEYLISDLHFALSQSKSLNYLSLSISSCDIFYGYVWLFYPESEDEEEQKQVLINTLKDTIENNYVPTLAIFENAWVETTVKDTLEQKKENELLEINWQRENLIELKKGADVYGIPVVLHSSKRFKNQYEEVLSRVWKKRWDAWCQAKSWESIKETFIFRRFMVASRGMIDEVGRIATLNLRKTGHSLPTVLVVGGPGAGKETIAKMISLFTDDYWECKPYTINIASLKPPAVAPELLMGFKAEINGSRMFSFLGLFEKIIVREKMKLEKAGKTDEIRGVVILDELNSLDTDAQGSLLRLIENSELVPIGSLRPLEEYEGSKMNFLIIGTMNEDPERLTKESLLRHFIGGSTFGGMLGEILYEHLRKTRRLREDLYYRFVRGGKITLPPLEERRSDIPILFYVFCSAELDNGMSLYIPLDVFEELTAKHLKWPGNVRQLQSLAQIVVRHAREDRENAETFSGDERSRKIFVIERKHLRDSLKEVGVQL